jgi:uncharacterized protein (DUF2336 family)
VTRLTFSRLVQVMITLAAVVGLVDAIGRRQADLAIVFTIIVVLGVLVLVHSMVGRRDVPVRRDLVRWMADRAAREGEEVEAVADRAIAAYRAGFVGASEPDPTIGP